jgi:uncharacterized protein
MKNAIIVHGMPSKREDRIAKALGIKYSKFHWLGWLGRQLRRRGFEVWAPEMPHAYRPEYELWSEQVEKSEIGPDTTLIGHSCGGGFWIKYLSLHKDLKVGKVILVAPWLDPDGNEAGDFFKDFKMDPGLAARTKGLVIFNSDNDMGNVMKSVARIRKTIKNSDYREFKNYGHFTIFTMKTAKFPELLAECLEGNT